MSSKKPITADNPALAFISSASGNEDILETLEVKKTNTTTQPKKVAKNENKRLEKTEAKEKRDYRVNLALTSSLGEQLKARAWREHRSVNNLVEAILNQYLND